MRLWDAMKADGVPREEREAALERTLRAAWPQTREWKYLCNLCSDIGLRMQACPGDATCGRLKAHLPHDFGRPCWCEHGARFKEKQHTEDDAIATAAKVKKPTRIGR